MLAVSTTMSSGAAQQQHPATGNGGGGDIDAAALDLLWGDGASVLPPLSDVGAGPSSSNANGKRPLAAINHAGIVDASALGLDGSIAEHLAYEYGTRTPGDTARPAPPPEEGDDDDVEEGGSGDGGSGDVVEKNRARKAPRTGARKAASGPSESAARAKANRERARRERLNDFFAELVRVMAPCLNPGGGEGTDGASTSAPAGAAAAGGGNDSASASAAAAAASHNLLRTDKTSVVADAIRLITALRAENGQLKQLNKFMEQRLASVERERAELLMRAAFAAGVAQNGNNAAGPSTSAAAAGPSSAPPVDAAAAVAMLPPPWLPPSDLDTSLDGSKRPPAA